MSTELKQSSKEIIKQYEAFHNWRKNFLPLCEYFDTVYEIIQKHKNNHLTIFAFNNNKSIIIYLNKNQSFKDVEPILESMMKIGCNFYATEDDSEGRQFKFGYKDISKLGYISARPHSDSTHGCRKIPIEEIYEKVIKYKVICDD